MNEIPKIEINMDRPCIQCGKPGACKRRDGSDGLCLECTTKVVTGITTIFKGKVKDMDISDKMIKQAEAEISNLLEEHIAEINEAYIKAENELTISLGLKFVPGKGAGEIKMTTSIASADSKIKESNTVTFDINQKQLFD